MDFVLRYEIYQFYKTISESFQPTPLEMVFIFLGIAVLAGTLIGVYRYQNKKARDEALRSVRRYFERIVSKAGLDPEERELLYRIAEVSPAGEMKGHIILQRAAAFDEAAGVLIDSGEISPDEAAGLREKLSACCFTENHGVATTKDLPAGLHLYITEGRSPGFHGEIGIKTPETLQIGLRDGSVSFDQDTQVTCYFKRSTDTFYFRAPVIESLPGSITLAHPRKIKKVQRRRFYRKELRKQAYIQRGDGKFRKQTVITDLGGGGASVKNKDRIYHKGDSVILTFSIPDYGEVNAGGAVVRTSADGEILHIRFDPMKERVRDKIISYILHK